MTPALDADALARSLKGLRLARVSNAIEDVREHSENSPLLEAFARGELDGDVLLDQVAANIERRRHGR